MLLLLGLSLDDLLSPIVVLAALGLLGSAWGVSRSGAIAGWKSVAEARKERITEIEAAQARAEARETALANQVAELQQRGDVTAVLENQQRILTSLEELKETLDDLKERWG